MRIEQRAKQDSGEANFVDLVEGKYDNADNGQESIQGQIEQVEKEIQANTAMLNENVARLPEPETVSVDEHPGLLEKLEEYKKSILENRNDFMTKLGLISTAALASPIAGFIASQGGFPNMPATAESGIAIAATTAAVGLFVAAADQIIARIGAYMDTRKYKKDLLAGETN